jgi:transcriptional regulator with XRE-family HTH domain
VKPNSRRFSGAPKAACFCEKEKSDNIWEFNLLFHKGNIMLNQMHPDVGVALLPGVPVLLKTRKSRDYETPPQRLGEHLRHCRIARNLSQGEAAALMGTLPLNVSRWERGGEPEIGAMPAILRFLGYNPFPPPRTLPEQLLAKRRAMGWTVREAARMFQVNQKTWVTWEHGEVAPKYPTANRLAVFLEGQ